MRDTYSTSPTAIEQGWDVYGDDDEHLGSVQGIGENYLLLQKGLFFTKDIYVPHSAITDAADGVVRVNVGKAELESMGWDAPPTDPESGSFSSSRGASTTSDVSGYASESDATDRGSAERQRMALHEEELEARTTPRQAGEVEVTKEIVEEQQTIEVPVRREEVHVRRVAADRTASADETAFVEGRETLRVPVMEEQVEIVKRPRVREEVEIEKVAREDTRHVTDTVRREELDVSGTAGVNVSSYGDSSHGDASSDADRLDDESDDQPTGRAHI